MASKETNNRTVVRITVIGDKSSNALNFLLSSLTGAGSASIATPSTHYGTIDERSHRIVKDMYIDPSLAKRGAKKQNINPNTRRIRKEQSVRLVLTAERPNDHLDFEVRKITVCVFVQLSKDSTASYHNTLVLKENKLSGAIEFARYYLQLDCFR